MRARLCDVVVEVVEVVARVNVVGSSKDVATATASHLLKLTHAPESNPHVRVEAT